MRKPIFFILKLTLLAVVACRGLPKEDENDGSGDAAEMHLNTMAQDRLVVLGDSIASGMFADTTLGAPLTGEQVNRFLTIYRLSKEEDPNSEAFYVDAQKVGASPASTAFAGEKDFSFARRLEQRLGVAVGIDRYAISGATTVSMATETARMARTTSAYRKPPTLVVLHIGANDFCARATIDDFRSSFHARLNEIVSAAHGAPIFIAGIPDVPQVLSQPDQVAFTTSDLQVKCSEVRSTLKLCQDRPIGRGATADSYAADEADLKAMNDVIESEIAATKSQQPSLSIAFQRYQFPTITPDLLAIDCFHPSITGQKSIADQTWPAAEALLPK